MSTASKLLRALLACTLLLTVVPPSAVAAAPASVGLAAIRPSSTAEDATNRVIVKLEDSSAEAVSAMLARYPTSWQTSDARHGITSLRVPDGMTTEEFKSVLAADTNVSCAVPDFVRYPSALLWPNDAAFNDSHEESLSPVMNAHWFGKSWWMRGPSISATPWASGLDAGAVWVHGYSDPAARYFPLRASSSSFTVAVLDTGFYMDHYERGNVFAGKDEFARRDPDGTLIRDDTVDPAAMVKEAIDFEAHGTAVAGMIAARTGNGLGVVGVGYDATVKMYKVSGPDYDPVSPYWNKVYIDEEALIQAVYDATDDGCKVINMSLDGESYDPLLQDAIDYAWSKGVIICAAMGNTGGVSVLYPANNDNVLGVGSYSVCSSGGAHKSDFSTYGPRLDFLAPGDMIFGLTSESVLTTFLPTPPEGVAPVLPPPYNAEDTTKTYWGLKMWSGTSMASAAAAGAIAHLWRYQPAFTNAEMVDYVEQHMPPIGSNRPNDLVGYGFLKMSTVMDGFMDEYPYLEAPVITSASTATVGVRSLTWGGVSGRSVRYRVKLDGTEITTTPGTSISLGLSSGVHTATVQAISDYNWWDGTSLSTKVITVSPVSTTSPGGWSDFSPDWSPSLTPTCSVKVRDAVSGVEPSKVKSRFSTDGGATWSAWATATCSAIMLSTATETISAKMPFGNENDAGNEVQFQATSGSGGTAESPAYDVAIDATKPSGTMVIEDGAASVDGPKVTLTLGVTDLHPVEMRFSVDSGVSWTAWEPNAASKLLDLPIGNGVKQISGQFRDPAGNVLSLSGSIVLAAPATAVRTAGSDRYDTAIHISEERFASADTVVIASGEGFPDALAASALAGSYSAPLLLTPKAGLYAGLPAEIARLGARHAIVIGAEASVSRAAFDSLVKCGLDVDRISGVDRYETAALIAAEVKRHEESEGRVFANKAFLARGDTFPDALAASPLAYSQRIPILLTKKSEIPNATWQGIWHAMPSPLTSHVYILGSTAAIDGDVASALALNLRPLTRIGGTDRYETALDLAEFGADPAQGWATWGFVGIATGKNFPDALGGGAAMGKEHGVMLLTPADYLSPACVTGLSSHVASISVVDVFGGDTAVSPDVFASIADIL